MKNLNSRIALVAAFAALAASAAPAIAQVAVPLKPSASPTLPPGLYVQVIDGLITVTNPAGTQNFSAGQFGFTPSISQPPVTVPKNPAMQFTPPPVFNSTNTTQSSASAAVKSNAVDCEVR